MISWVGKVTPWTDGMAFDADEMTGDVIVAVVGIAGAMMALGVALIVPLTIPAALVTVVTIALFIISWKEAFGQVVRSLEAFSVA